MKRSFTASATKRPRPKNVISRVLWLLILLISFSYPVSAASGADKPWVAAGLQELESMRTRASKHFQKANGKITVYSSPVSLHYRNAQGQWQDISTDIKSSGDPLQPFSAEHNAVKTYFPADPFKGVIRMSSREGEFTESVRAIVFTDINDKVILKVPVGGTISSVIEGNKITYSGFHPALSLVYSLGNDGRKFDLVVSSPAFFSALPAGVTSLKIVEEIVSSPGRTNVSADALGARLNVGGTNVLGISRPFAYDSKPGGEAHIGADLMVANEDGVFTVTSTFDVKWLSHPSRIFPLHLDPIVNYYPQNSNFWTGYQTSSTGKTNGFLRVASTGTTAWAKFDISALPPGAVITSATYYGYHYTTTGANKITEIRGLDNVDPVPTAAGPLFTQITTGPLYNNNYTFGGATFQWQPGVLGGSAFSDIIASISQGWFGLGFSYASGNTTFMYQYGYNAASTSNIPYLELDYTTTPCSGMPDSNMVIAPMFSVCPGETATLTLANQYTVNGLTYQWMASTSSSVGPFTAIGNATSNVLNHQLGTGHTWFISVVTCTNVGLGTYTTPASVVLVQSTTTNNVPYAESFEGIGLEDRMPNCSWSASGPNVSTRTYTSAETSNRIPHSGSSYAAFSNNAGTHYYYTNGIEMVPGITYSASLYFTTDLSGSTNWTDLGIHIGTSQSPSGLVPIAVINGPAVSPVYKQLSNTFTVAAPGLYYLAIKATAAAGGAPYLSWDDLTVTIPCEAGANTPTITLSAASSTICQGQQAVITAAGSNSISWSTGASGITLVDLPFSTTTYQATGTNILTGCQANASILIHVKASPLVGILASPPTVCIGKPVTLMASGANAYSWSNGGVGPVITVTPSANSSYSVIGTGTNNCTGNSLVQVGVHSLPSVSAVGLRSEICRGEGLELNASGADSYIWISGIDPQLFAGQKIFVYPASTGAYTVTGTDVNGCENSAAVTVVVNECTSIAEQTAVRHAVRLFPNPASRWLTVNSVDKQMQRVTIADMTGKTVLEQELNASDAELDLGLLAAGVYSVRIETRGGEAKVLKLIKN